VSAPRLEQRRRGVEHKPPALEMDWPDDPPRWWRNGLGWLMFVVGPGCGLAVGLAIGKVL
jgi:hypothetical protein